MRLEGAREKNREKWGSGRLGQDPLEGVQAISSLHHDGADLEPKVELQFEHKMGHQEMSAT
eukprot:11834523-Karenia_brevis.AAC.1